MRSEPHVVVVGAGIGGLVSALLLAARGVAVTLVEAQAEPGGKMRRVAVDGAWIDAGPTVFTMRWVFEQILAQAGATLDDTLALQPLGVLARHAWRGEAQTLDLYADAARSADAIAAFSSPAEARRFQAFCRQAREVYQALEAPYIRGHRPSLLSLGRALGPRGLATLAGLGPFANLWSALAKHFHDPRLQQLFGRYATYCGASPWGAPATLMLVAQVELDGVWAVGGGMHAVAQAFAALGEARGVVPRYGCAVRRIVVDSGRTTAVELANGERLPADAVVFNGDAQALALGLLGDDAKKAVRPRKLAQRSLSAVTWAVHARAQGFPLVRHNVFFDHDYRSEFDDIFRQRRLPQQGTVYVCAQDRDDHAAGPAGPAGAERLLCLVNAPADGDSRRFDPEETDPCEHRSLALLRQCGLQLTPQAHQVQRTTPHDFHQLFPGSAGALYGMATHGWLSSFQRPGAASAVSGLYLAGGSVHPGPGVPMAALSGWRAAEALMAGLVSTRRWRPAVTSGGTSMPSAMTAATR
ncbi:MAG: phytoene desaturase [Rubrivivax sp.]|nr:phytoene desaturase [Rubrivivax sp.]